MPPLNLWVSVFELGCFAGLIGLAYLLILRGADIFQFALGPFAMFSAAFASFLVARQGLPLALSVTAGIGAAIAISLITELSIVRPIFVRTGGEELPAIIAIVAVLFAVQQLAGTLFGRRPLPGQSWLAIDPIRIGRATITGQTIVLGVATLILFVGTALWLKHASFGRMLRAVGDNYEAATTLGLPVNKIRLVAFILGGLIVGIAGPIFAAKAGVTFQSGLAWTLAGFLALIVGGLGRVWAPLLGGFIVATLQTMSVYYFGPASLHYTTFVVAFLFFAFRPKGLFAPRVRL